MKEVAMELEGMKAMEKHPWVKGNLDSEESEYLLRKPYNDCVGTGSSSSDSACYDGIKNQVTISILNDGR